MHSALSNLPVAVIGAGPIGLAAAAHLHSRGFTPLILEAGATAAAGLKTYEHVQLFSPWRYNIDKAAKQLLEQHGWRSPDPEVLPTAGELVRSYLQPLAALPALAPQLYLSHRVVSIARANIDKVKTSQREAAPFALRVTAPDGEREFLAQAVIDASGTWSQPNPVGASGVPALGESALAGRIAYGMPDILGAQRTCYAGKRVLVLGSGHSAAGNLLALAKLAESSPTTQMVWAIRGENWTKILGGGEADGLPARGQLGQRVRQLRDGGRLQVHTSFRVHELRSDKGRITVYGAGQDAARPHIGGIEEIIAATGSRPDLAMTRELRLKLDHWLESTEALAPLIDPNEHSCGTVRPHGHRELAHPEAGYYAVGAKSYGRAPTFLMATGYEQVRSIAAALAGDLVAANDVQLDLPETGVCSVNFGPVGKQTPAIRAESCCGGPASKTSEACCAADEQAKKAGAAGCGCSPPVLDAEPKPRACCG
ncbi:MAG: NAD(P)-binding domain-containing protein [Steroidobacter sp.]